jgi:hypothetical protein
MMRKEELYRILSQISGLKGYRTVMQVQKGENWMKTRRKEGR